MDKEEKEIKNPIVKKTNYVAKILKWLSYLVAIFVALIVVLYGVLSIPAVQRQAVDFALGELRIILKTEVSIDGVSLGLFNHVNLKGVYIEDQAKDTLLYAENLDVRISPLSLFHNKLLINAIELENVIANLSQKTSDSDFNFQFIIDAFASTDTVAVDTTKSSFVIDIEDVKLTNAKFRYDILSDTVTPGLFNASHIKISDLNANLQLPGLDPKNLDITLSSLSLKEESGVEITNLEAHLTSNENAYHLRNVMLTLPRSELKIPEAHYNISTDEFEIATERAKLSKLDLFPFMPSLKFLQNDVTIETTIKGKLPFINVEKLIVGYGEETNINAKASISDYDRYDLAELNLEILSLQIMPDAIADFVKLGDSTFVSPDILDDMGKIRFLGELHGELADLHINAEAWVKQGSIQLVASGAIDTTFNNYDVKAKLQTQNFNLGNLLAEPEFGRLSMHLNLTASQSTKKSLSADVKGLINSLQYHKLNYTNIPFTAFYNASKMGAWIKGDFTAGRLEAEVDMTQDLIPKINVDLNVEKLQVDKFIDSLHWQNPLLSFHLKGNLVGLDLAKLQADFMVENFVFLRDSLSFVPGNFGLKAGLTNSSIKYINLESSFLNAKIEGEYNFATLINEAESFMHQYLPSIFSKAKRNQRKKYPQNNFNFSLEVNNTENLSRIFDLPASVIKPLLISGRINTKDSVFKAIANIPLVEFGDLSILNTRIDINNNNSLMKLLGNTDLYTGSETVKFELDTKIESDTIGVLLTAKSDTGNFDFNGSVQALANFRFSDEGELISYVNILPTDLNVGRLRMSLLNAKIENEGVKTTISNFGFTVGKNRMLSKFFGVDGIISDQKTDTLNVSFFNANLGEVLEAFDVNNISAVANGNIKITDAMGTPELYMKSMSLNNIVVFNDTLGDLNMQSYWSDEMKAIGFRANLENAKTKGELKGWVYPSLDSLNLKLNLDRLSINWVQPFVSDMLNETSGSISTGLNVKGRISAPLIDGWLGVNDAKIGVDYTNVVYQISDTIHIEPNKIGFDNLIIEDSYKNKASVSALVTYTNFEDIKYSLDANLNNLLVLNTATRTDSLFYGKVFASGTVSVKGSDDLIDMKMKIKNGKNSNLNIQIPQTSSATVYQSVVYINVPEEHIIEKVVEEIPKTLPLRLAVDLDVTPDFQLGVIINPLTGDAMQVKGAGLIKFSYDMQSEAMLAFGDYRVSDGFVKLKLQNIKTLLFKIRDGSKLVFVGDPLKTSFDITAFRRQKVDMKTLDPSFSEQGVSKENVDCELLIKGNLDKMEVSYDITLPDASDDVKQRVKSLIATEDQKTIQFAYLVISNMFHADGASIGGTMADGVLTNVASNALANSLNSLLGNALGDKWGIGANISSNDGTFSDVDLTVSLSRKFMDDKLEFNSNVGYRTDQASNDNPFIGDFDIGYVLTDHLKVKVFNKTNDKLYKQAPTTQGIGLVYTKEAKRIKDLFQIFKKKRKRTGSKQTQIEGGK